MKPKLLALLTATLLAVACGGGEAEPPFAEAAQAKDAIIVTSPNFEPGQPLPDVHSLEGGNLSPTLAWDSVPPEAKSLAIICRDPDAPRGDFIHWVVYNIPGDHDGIDIGDLRDDSLAGGVRQGTNDFGRTGYDGPAPPPGKPHRYFFTVYALDALLEPGADKVDAARLEALMQDHVLARGELVGTFQALE